MNIIIIDVREPFEFAQGHVEGAINIPPQQLMTGAPALAHTAKDTPLVVYCRSGSRSAVAKNILSSLGFTNITNGINQDHVRKYVLHASE